MHEFSVTERLFQLAMEQANLVNGERIQRLEIELDSNSGYTPDAIRFYFEQLAQGTPASTAELSFQFGNYAEHIRLTSIQIDDSSPTDDAPQQQAGLRTPILRNTNDAPEGTTARWLIRISGLVHDAAFLPFVSELAKENTLSGWVANTATGVAVEAQGQLRDLEHFCHHLQHDAPPSTKIMNIGFNTIALVQSDTFEIR